MFLFLHIFSNMNCPHEMTLNNFMKFAGKWMELENVILSEVLNLHQGSFALQQSQTVTPNTTKVQRCRS
ncbi:hypothetical protein STEG23_017492 [Scotinomys teguina]